MYRPTCNRMRFTPQHVVHNTSHLYRTSPLYFHLSHKTDTGENFLSFLNHINIVKFILCLMKLKNIPCLTVHTTVNYYD